MRFTSPQQALRWAFEINSKPIITLSTGADSGELCWARGKSSNGSLTPHERNAQSVSFLDLCEHLLPPLHLAYIRVQFGRRAAGLDVLVHHLAANFGTGLHRHRSLELIVRAYCGEKIGLRDIRKSMACGMLKAFKYRNDAFDTLEIIHLQAITILREEMEKRGMLPRAVVPAS